MQAVQPAKPFAGLDDLQPARTVRPATAASNDQGGSLGTLLGAGAAMAAGLSQASVTPVASAADSLDVLFGLQAGSPADPLAPGGIFDRYTPPSEDVLCLAPNIPADITQADHAPGVHSSMRLPTALPTEAAPQIEPPQPIPAEAAAPTLAPASTIPEPAAPAPAADSLDALFGLNQP